MMLFLLDERQGNFFVSLKQRRLKNFALMKVWLGSNS
jgi:hypothetical protein